MTPIAFFDAEVNPDTRQILDIGAIKADGSHFHSNSVTAFIQFLQHTRYVCGHNIVRHDLAYLGKAIENAGIPPTNAIDTLLFSPLLFPKEPFHNLVKDDKLQSDSVNNPLNDSIKAKDLFYAQQNAFREINDNLQQIFYLLLGNIHGFAAFFRYLGFESRENVELLIRKEFKSRICDNFQLTDSIRNYPVELAYCLALIHTDERPPITPRWVFRNYPEVDRILHELRSSPCEGLCTYCGNTLNIHRGLKRYFGFEAFRRYGEEPLQERAVQAAVRGESLLAVFPTGGGKSVTFQLPALIGGESAKGLTVVISPLQSLMKDQVDNLEKAGIADAVTINGLLDPIERSLSFERVESGQATLLYISPESLRSKTIEKLLIGRKIIRFVIDEAHCFSAWGQDFRVDYLYIGEFIRGLQQEKKLSRGIPISCFTATAKQKVIEDIREYFRRELSIELSLFTTSAARSNLLYKVSEKVDEEDKYDSLRELLEKKNVPTIIYVSRTKKVDQLAERLNADGYAARPYHGRMEAREKIANQNAFISGQSPIMVATSAFGMGVDKKDVGLVIHYEISDSLENYVQEAGRAGRDENIEAECHVLFREEDLNEHFKLLKQTKLSIQEIKQIWKAIKDMTKFRPGLSNSALEIARQAGWDDNIFQLETRVITAIAALEQSGYLKRGQNSPRVYADSILAKNADEAVQKIRLSTKFSDQEKVNAIRIIKKLISSRSRQHNTEEQAESRVDYISDHLGISREETIRIITILRAEKLLADNKDLTAYIKAGENSNNAVKTLRSIIGIEAFLLSYLSTNENMIHVKELIEKASQKGIRNISLAHIRTILNFWSVKNWIRKKNHEYSKNHISVKCLVQWDKLEERIKRRNDIAEFTMDYLYQKSSAITGDTNKTSNEKLLEFSILELKESYENTPRLFKFGITLEDVENSLLFLSKTGALKIEGGFLVSYNRLHLKRIEKDNSKQYTKKDYENLDRFYENKIQQIHIVGEYAKKMIRDYKSALQFVEDYFTLSQQAFLTRYFKGNRKTEIGRTLTPGKFQQLFGTLSPAQLEILQIKNAKNIIVLAGPGSGKTKLLVHKLASLNLLEEVKQEQMLMVTFSRAAATEFKKRLIQLIGNAAGFIDIKTFHSYCFDVLGKIGSLHESEDILSEAIQKIRKREVEPNRITKTVLVIDEAQDMSEQEFELVKALMEYNEEMQVILVGDDDQNIYEFRKSSSRYLESFLYRDSSQKRELIDNFRSKKNLVEFSNQVVLKLQKRLKDMPIVPVQQENGRLRLIRHVHHNLVKPLVSDIIASGLPGSTCVLTNTNDEAQLVAGVLLKNGISAKLIQSNDQFELSCIAELRFFLEQTILPGNVPLINQSTWDLAELNMKNRFSNSSKLELCLSIIREFQASNPASKYRSDLEIFLRESKLEDFYPENKNTVLVSTIHKAKGKEFDNVFLLLENFQPTSQEKIRLVYVGLTRAKTNLTIHLNTDFLDGIDVDGLQRKVDSGQHTASSEIMLHCSHRDVHLGFFETRQPAIRALISGDTLLVTGDTCGTTADQPVLQFSQSFQTKLQDLYTKGFRITSAKVNFILYWYNRASQSEIKIILPELQLEKGI